MTIQDVARLAGVPYATTWRAIRQSGTVSPEAAEAVRQAVEKSGFNVNKARRPRSSADGDDADQKAGRKIALLDLRNTTALSISILRGVQRILGERGMNLLYAHVLDHDKIPPALEAGEVDGILGYGELPAHLITPELMRVPAVWMMSRSDGSPDPWGDRVAPDNRSIGQLAARYLLDRGHKHLAMLNPGGDVLLARERWRGFHTVASERKIHADLVGADEQFAHDQENAAQQVVDRWMAMPHRATGLSLPADRLAEAVYRQLIARGIEPGKDVEIISVDNAPEYLNLMKPSPASIDLNRATIARLAAERLLWRMSEGLSSPSALIAVRPSLAGYDK